MSAPTTLMCIEAAALGLYQDMVYVYIYIYIAPMSWFIWSLRLGVLLAPRKSSGAMVPSDVSSAKT